MTMGVSHCPWEVRLMHSLDSLCSGGDGSLLVLEGEYVVIWFYDNYVPRNMGITSGIEIPVK